MNDITFMITRRGEGKTRWLLEIAHKLKNNSLKLYTETPTEYSLFCEKYFYLYNEICPVEKLDIQKILPEDVILIDDLFSSSLSALDVRYIQRNSHSMYVTLEGCSSQIVESISSNELTISDNYEVQLNG